MPLDPSAEDFPTPDPTRRRLLLGGASLLALGLVFNATRFVAMEPEALEPEQLRPRKLETKSDGSHHHGEEGRMGRPTSKAKSGLYAMRGPKYAAPVPPPSEDVWAGLTGTEVGQAYGAGGLGLVGTGRGGGGTGEGTIGLGSTGLIGKGGGRGTVHEPTGGTLALPPGPSVGHGFVSVSEDPRSTFSIDVDTASYSATRRSLIEGRLPEPDSVRLEELVNYFDYDYVAPTGDVPFSVTAEVGECPWNPEHELVHVGLQGQVIANDDLPARNLVFLVDVSGSMSEPDKLPLVKHSLSQLVGTLRDQDRISLVVYAGAAGVVLPPTPGNDAKTIGTALGRLGAGGSTNGGEGIVAAYEQARAAFMEDGVNRVILASDGDFNVGVSSHEELVELVEKQRKSGIELSVLGYGMGHRDHTMEQLADKGNGNYAYIDGPEEAHKVLVEQAGGTLVTIAKDVKIQVELDPTRVQSYRLVGYDNRRLAHEDFADDEKDAGEIGAGHSVTALYEVVPQPQAPADAPWMTVSMRYKQPKGEKSLLLELPVAAEPRALADTSDDFRFSAAVASFAMLLHDAEPAGQAPPTTEKGEAAEPPITATWASTQALALQAVGDDPTCRRHRFIELVGKAGALAGDLEVSDGSVKCPAEAVRGRTTIPELAPAPYSIEYPEEPEPEPEPEPSDWSKLLPWVLEVLRLLPPLLALPLFVMALRRPRWRD